MDNTPGHSNTLSKKFCSLSSKVQVLPSARSCQFAEAPAGVRVLLIHQKFPPKNPTVIWVRAVCKNKPFPTNWKYCLLATFFSDEAHEWLLPSMYSVAEIPFQMRHTVPAAVFLKQCSQAQDCVERNHKSDFSTREGAAQYNT